MNIALITGSSGLVGSESVEYFINKGMTVVGLDNDMRKTFFGDEASTAWNRDRLKEAHPEYRHEQVDIRDQEGRGVHEHHASGFLYRSGQTDAVAFSFED